MKNIEFILLIYSISIFSIMPLSKPLQLWQQALKEYKSTHKDGEGKIILAPKKGTAAYKKVKARYEELKKKAGLDKKKYSSGSA